MKIIRRRYLDEPPPGATNQTIMLLASPGEPEWTLQIAAQMPVALSSSDYDGPYLRPARNGIPDP